MSGKVAIVDGTGRALGHATAAKLIDRVVGAAS
jgi:NAD(P)-dependent dehydrogenase (short-subunit alcohol dehydrogenase family)